MVLHKISRESEKVNKELRKLGKECIRFIVKGGWESLSLYLWSLLINLTSLCSGYKQLCQTTQIFSSLVYFILLTSFRSNERNRTRKPHFLGVYEYSFTPIQYQNNFLLNTG